MRESYEAFISPIALMCAQVPEERVTPALLHEIQVLACFFYFLFCFLGWSQILEPACLVFRITHVTVTACGRLDLRLNLVQAKGTAKSQNLVFVGPSRKGDYCLLLIYGL